MSNVFWFVIFFAKIRVFVFLFVNVIILLYKNTVKYSCQELLYDILKMSKN